MCVSVWQWLKRSCRRESREGMGRTLKVLEWGEWGESDINIVIMSKFLKKCFQKVDTIIASFKIESQWKIFSPYNHIYFSTTVILGFFHKRLHWLFLFCSLSYLLSYSLPLTIAINITYASRFLALLSLLLCFPMNCHILALTPLFTQYKDYDLHLRNNCNFCPSGGDLGRLTVYTYLLFII